MKAARQSMIIGKDPKLTILDEIAARPKRVITHKQKLLLLDGLRKGRLGREGGFSIDAATIAVKLILERTLARGDKLSRRMRRKHQLGMAGAF